MFKYLHLFRLVSVVLVALIFLLGHEPLAAQSLSPFFYYYEGARIPLTLDPAHIAIRFKSDVPAETRRVITAQTGDLQDYDQRIDTGALGVAIAPLRAARDPLAVIGKLETRPEVQTAGYVYRFSDGGLYAETDEFIVRFKPDTSQGAINLLNQLNRAEVIRQQPYSQGVFILRIGAGSTRRALDVANAYVESGLVEFAEPNFVMVEPQVRVSPLQAQPSALAPPNDTFWGYQWALDNTGQFFGAQPGIDIQALDAWGVTQGSSGITIAVLDEGVAPAHPDLQNKLVTGINVTVVPNTSDTTPNTNDMHGTAVAGVVGASSNNSVGIAGTCWYCQIMPVKVAFEDGSGNWVTTPAQLASGIDWAWQNGADVLSNSWTMSGPSSDVTASIVNARYGGRGGLGSTLVFAAGNGDSSGVSYPANLKYVIGVGATNWCDQRKSKTNNNCNNDDPFWGSNYGPSLDLVAPGEALYTTCTGNRCQPLDPGVSYTIFSGTSASTPLVAGVVGLLYSLNPNLKPDEVLTALQNGATHLPPTPPDTGTGYQRLQASGAISALYNLSIGLSKGPGLALPGDTIQYTITYSNTGMTAINAPGLDVMLPTGLGYIGSNPTFTLQSGAYHLNLAPLPRNASGSATFTVQVQQGTGGQTLPLTAQISSAFPELYMSDNTAADQIAVAKQYLFLPLVIR
ncbi:MAG: S8 family serine peptidase [Anaerolineae bacterium]